MCLEMKLERRRKGRRKGVYLLSSPVNFAELFREWALPNACSPKSLKTDKICCSSYSALPNSQTNACNAAAKAASKQLHNSSSSSSSNSRSSNSSSSSTAAIGALSSVTGFGVCLSICLSIFTSIYLCMSICFIHICLFLRVLCFLSFVRSKTAHSLLGLPCLMHLFLSA